MDAADSAAAPTEEEEQRTLPTEDLIQLNSAVEQQGVRSDPPAEQAVPVHPLEDGPHAPQFPTSEETGGFNVSEQTNADIAATNARPEGGVNSQLVEESHLENAIKLEGTPTTDVSDGFVTTEAGADDGEREGHFESHTPIMNSFATNAIEDGGEQNRTESKEQKEPSSTVNAAGFEPNPPIGEFNDVFTTDERTRSELSEEEGPFARNTVGVDGIPEFDDIDITSAGAGDGRGNRNDLFEQEGPFANNVASFDPNSTTEESVLSVTADEKVGDAERNRNDLFQQEGPSANNVANFDRNSSPEESATTDVKAGDGEGNHNDLFEQDGPFASNVVSFNPSFTPEEFVTIDVKADDSKGNPNDLSEHEGTFASKTADSDSNFTPNTPEESVATGVEMGEGEGNRNDFSEQGGPFESETIDFDSTPEESVATDVKMGDGERNRNDPCEQEAFNAVNFNSNPTTEEFDDFVTTDVKLGGGDRQEGSFASSAVGIERNLNTEEFDDFVTTEVKTGNGEREEGPFVSNAVGIESNLNADEFDDFVTSDARAGDRERKEEPFVSNGGFQCNPNTEDFDDFAASNDVAGNDDFDDFASAPVAAEALPMGTTNKDTFGEVEGNPNYDELAKIDVRMLDVRSPNLEEQVYKTCASLFPIPDESLQVGDNTDDQEAQREGSEMDLRGTEECRRLWERLSLEAVFLDKNGELVNKFRWKKSKTRIEFLDALEIPVRMDDFGNPTGTLRTSTYPTTTAPWQKTGAEGVENINLLVEEEIQKRPTTPTINTNLGFDSLSAHSSKNNSPVGSVSSMNAAATVALAASSRAQNLDLKEVRKICGISKAALMKRSTEELYLILDHFSQVAQNATAHLGYWLDYKEQETMDSEMNHKMIELLISHAQDVALEKASGSKDYKKRRKR